MKFLDNETLKMTVKDFKDKLSTLNDNDELGIVSILHSSPTNWGCVLKLETGIVCHPIKTNEDDEDKIIVLYSNKE